MKFWEASAIVPLLVTEATSADRRRLLESDPEVIAWWGTRVECQSALCRIERRGVADAERVWAARGRLAALSAAWHEIAPTESVRRRAESILRMHALRAADSLQLAAGLHAAESYPALAEYVCNDQRLALAARREGLRVL